MREQPLIRDDNLTSFLRNGKTSDGLSLEQGQGPSYNSENKKQINKKSKHKKVEQVTFSENVENYVGDRDLDDLVKFIEDENQSKKSNGSSDVKVEKPVKKNKDKKNKATVVPSIPKPGDHIVIDIEGQGEEITSSSSSDMGNSSDKVAESNQITDGNIVKKENGQIKALEGGEKSVSHKGQGRLDSETKTKGKIVKEDSQEKRSGTKSGNNVKKEVKVNGFNHSLDYPDLPLLKESTKSKDNKKMVTPISTKMASGTEIVNDKRKSKPQVETAHVSNDKDKKIANSSKSVNDFKSSLPTSPNPCKSDIDVSELDNKYIFTDLPVPLVEPEFTVVEKKKKKAIVHMKDQLPSGNFREFPLTKPKFRDHPPPMPRSVTPPPVKSRDKSQDFSLSAFPVLTNSTVTKEKSNSHEPRRSSIGELPLMGETSSLDDSDIASVKSLPAVQPAKMLDTFSARFQKSYAKIAAGPKPINLQGPDASLEDYSDESMDKPKQTVWKGSLTERRHSIGSSPEDGKNENPSGLTEKSRQKSGSQEVLKMEASPKSGANDNVNTKPYDEQTDMENMVVNSDIDEKCDKLSREASPCEYSDKPSTVCTNELIGKVHRNHENSPPISTIPSHTNIKHNSQDNSFPLQSFNLQQSEPRGGKEMSAPMCVAQSSCVTFMDSNIVTTYTNNTKQIHTKAVAQNAVTFSSVKSPVDSRSHPVPTSSPVNAKPQRNNNKTIVAKIPVNGRKNKSVVFLDNKRDTPSKLDITFGFDDITDDVNVKHLPCVNSENVVRTDGVTFCELRPDVTRVTPPSVGCYDDKNRIVNKPLNHVNPGHLQPGHMFSQTQLENEKSSGHNVPKTMHSLKEHLTLVNGVVTGNVTNVVPQNVNTQRIPCNPQTLPVEPIVDNRLVQTVRTESYKPASAPFLDTTATANVMCSPSLNQTPPVLVQDNKMRIIYGDAVVNRDSNNRIGSGGDSKFIHFVCSKNNCGKFNHYEAVSQLKKDWEDVMSLKMRRPNCVQMYAGQ